MAIPLVGAALGGMLAQFFMPLFRLLLGTVFAKQVYDFLNEKLMPKVNELVVAATQTAQGLDSFSGTLGQLFVFLDLSKVFALMLSTLLSCFVIKIFIVSVKAFGTEAAG